MVCMGNCEGSARKTAQAELADASAFSKIQQQKKTKQNNIRMGDRLERRGISRRASTEEARSERRVNESLQERTVEQ